MKSRHFFLMAVCFLFLVFSCAEADDSGGKPDPVNPEALNYVKKMGFGVNIGNTFDSLNTGNIAGETGWGNPRVTREFIRSLKNHGFKTVRLPVSWVDYMGTAPDYIIDETYMNRVEEVVNWILDEDMYCILNLHHDGGGGFNASGFIHEKYWIKQISIPEKEDEVTNRFIKVWEQIAGRFKDHSDKLVLEAYNEIGFDHIWNRYANQNTPEQQAGKIEAYRLVNKLNQTFEDAVRSTGGGNEDRFLLIPGYWTDIVATLDPYFKMPVDTAEYRLILSIHFYDPYRFTHAEAHAWGAPWDINSVNNRLESLNAFISKGIPVVNGEFAVSHRANDNRNGTPKDLESRRSWLLFVTQKCIDLGISPILWDTGLRSNNYGMGDIGRSTPFPISDAVKYVFDNLAYPAD